MVETASRLCPSLAAEAKTVRDRFTEAFGKFADCHTLYNGNYLADEDIDKLGIHKIIAIVAYIILFTSDFPEKNIKAFMQFYRATFPHATVLPKMHLMEDHMIPWLRKWHLGFGTMGEQGAESIHASFNSIERSFACMIHNRVERLLSVVKEHHLRISPANVNLLPPIKKRKKTD